MKMITKLSRRAMLRRSAQSVAGLAVAGTWAPLFADPAKRRFKIGACDWSIGKMGDPGSFEMGRQIGLDGVQVSLGTATNQMRLRRPEVQRQFLDAAQKAGLQIASLAIGELNEIPYKSDPRTIEWVRDSVEVCRALGM